MLIPLMRNIYLKCVKEKQDTVYEFLKEFSKKKWCRGVLNHLLEKNLTNLVVLNALPVVVDHGQHLMLKTLSLCTVKKAAHAAIVLPNR